MNEEMKKPLIILTGPTAVGKTRLSLSLAGAVGGEILSADSMQVYRHMDIGSAKIRPDQMLGVRHHLIDVLEPTEEFNVVVFQKLALQCMEEIYERGRMPILTGGTGFYIQSVLYGIDFTENGGDGSYRRSLETLAEKKGRAYLHAMLEEADPGAAAQIHPNNIKRVIRALEYHEQTGEKISEHNEAQRVRQPAYRSCYFVLTQEREKLYRAIDSRVDLMLKQGLVAEVEGLLALGCKREDTAMQGLGYKEIIDYLEGRTTLEQAVYLIKRDTRRFAKRQLTWFRRERDVIWLDKDGFEQDEDNILRFMLDTMKSRGLLKR